MDHLAFELTRQSTYAKLGPEELESLGKQASSDYLGGGISLNDAVVKIAKQYPSISSHQIRRIVEFANQETFSRLFEKQASDKNIEFNVADPGEILQSLNNGARPSIMTSDPPDYSIDPVAKTSASNVEADLALTRMFLGFDPASPYSERAIVAMAKQASNGQEYVTRILAVESPDNSEAIDRILKTASVSEEEARSVGDTLNVNFSEIPSDQFRRGIDTEYKEHHTPDDPTTNVINTRREAGQIALSHFKEIPKDRPKNYYTELDHMEEKMKGAAMGYEVMQRPPTQRATAQTAQQGGVNDPASGDHPEDIHQKNVRALDRRIEIEKKKQELAKTQFQTQELLQGGQPQQAQMAQQAAPQQAEQAAPQEAMQQEAAPQEAGQQAAPQQAEQQAAPQENTVQGGQLSPEEIEMLTQQQGASAVLPGQKTAAALTKTAMKYAKADRPGSEKVLEDLRAATSLTRIKQASARHEQYPMANPHGELIRTKQKISTLLDEALPARDTNLNMTKEAQAEFEHEVTQFMFNGGNLGEVAHVMETIGGNDPVIIKQATRHMVDHLIKRGMDSSKTQAEMINYEMTKSASKRDLNPESLIVSSFSNFFKLASNQALLNKTYSDVKKAHDQVETALKEVMRASSR